MNETAAIILAAGGSSRLGTPKQLLVYKGKTLLENAIEAALGAGLSYIVVVLGAYKNEIEPLLAKYSVQIVENDNWNLGMGSSIKLGLREVEKFENIRACLIMVCDQPHISKDLIERLYMKCVETNAKIVASFYGETLGVPALFHKDYFHEIKKINDQQGAKNLFSKYPESIAKITFLEGIVDIDTREDFENLK